MTDPHDFAAQGRLLATATPGPWWTDGFAMGLRHLRRNWEPYGEDCPDGFDLPTERDAIWLTDLRNTIDDLRAVVVAAQEFIAQVAKCVDSPTYRAMVSMAHIHGWVHDGPDWVQQRDDLNAALARFTNVGEVRS